VAGERVKLLGSRLAPGEGAPGRHLGGFRVACGSGAVAVTLAQRQGRRPLPPADLLRGWTLPERLD
jgi:methionyl-tRNA formyltransferase